MRTTDTKGNHCADCQLPRHKKDDDRFKTENSLLLCVGIVAVIGVLFAAYYGGAFRPKPAPTPVTIPPNGCVCGEPSRGRNCTVAIDILTNITCGIWTDLSPETLRGVDGIAWVSNDGGTMGRDMRYDWNGILDDICALHDQTPDDGIRNKNLWEDNPRTKHG